jgi:hypothetical protein
MVAFVFVRQHLNRIALYIHIDIGGFIFGDDLRFSDITINTGEAIGSIFNIALNGDIAVA